MILNHRDYRKVIMIINHRKSIYTSTIYFLPSQNTNVTKLFILFENKYLTLVEHFHGGLLWHSRMWTRSQSNER